MTRHKSASTSTGTGTRKGTQQRRQDPGGPRARLGALGGYRRVVTRLGGDPVPLLARHGLSPDALDDADAWFPYATLVDLLETTARALQRPDFGLELAAHQGLLAALGPVALVARHSENVAATLRALGAWLTVVQSRAISFDVEREPSGIGRLRWRLRLPQRARCAQVNELNQAVCMKILESLRGPAFEPLLVSFVHRRPADDRPQRAVFGERLRFGAEANEIRIAAVDMDAPNPGSDEVMRELARSYVERLGQGRRPDTVARTRQLIDQLLPTGDCSLAAVADDQELEPRTLQRRLRAAGTDFRTLLEQARRTFALQYIADPELPLIRIAARVGYADQPTFTRAFRAWFGSTPGALRARLTTESGRKQES